MNNFLLIAVGFIGVAGIIASTFLVTYGFSSAGRWVAKHMRQLRDRARGTGARRSDTGEKP